MDVLLDLNLWFGLVAIVAMESVLGIDNLVYLALLTDNQPEAKRSLAERIGLGVAVASRLVLVLIVAQVLDLTQPIVSILEQAVSWRDIVMVTGGIILLIKGTQEIYGVVEGPSDKMDDSTPIEGEENTEIRLLGIAQMVLIDLAFATDSVASAFALSTNIWVVTIGLLGGMAFLYLMAGPLSSLFTKRPSIRVLAFGFMLMLGMTLIADGLNFSIPKGFIFFALGLSALVEGLEISFHRKG
jgi:predicted tellurium resistance membrane protein TerC